MNSRPFRRAGVVIGVLTALLASTSTAFAEPVEDAVSTFAYSQNMHPMGFSARSVPLNNTVAGQGRFNSDFAFWGRTAYQGTYNGFRIVDITEPDSPVQLLNYEDCRGDQGDVLVWDNLLIRSWNSGASATATCAGELVGQGFEGCTSST